MKAERTQKRVYNNIQRRGSTLTLPVRTTIGTVQNGVHPFTTLKALIIEDPARLPFQWKQDYKDIPSRDSIFFLLGIPQEPFGRDVNGNPIDKAGLPVILEQPEKARADYVRDLFPRGREFTCNRYRYVVLREIPLIVSDVNLYIMLICDTK